MVVRLILIALVVLLVWYVLWQGVLFLKGRQIDWTGVSFAAAFVALAFYLRYVTGLG
jgi:hypothetical protein